MCYKNGSLTREEVRDRVAEGSWERFNALLDATPAGNGGRIGFFFREAEITPQGALGYHRFDATDALVAAFSPAEEVRAVVEGQFLSMRLHAANIGMRRFASVLVTGGASTNRRIAQVIANVFGVPVYTAQTANSASLGAAYRALHGYLCRQRGEFVPFREVTARAVPFSRVADPDPDAHRVYSEMLPRYSALEKRILQASPQK